MGTLRKVSRCADMLSKATGRLSSVCMEDHTIMPLTPRISQSMSSLNGLSLELKPHPRLSSTSAALLSDSQLKQIHRAADEVTFATQALIGHVKMRLPADTGNTGKVKRMLPIPPGAGQVTTVVASKRRSRCHSAKARISRNMSMIELNSSTSINT